MYFNLNTKLYFNQKIENQGYKNCFEIVEKYNVTQTHIIVFGALNKNE